MKKLILTIAAAAVVGLFAGSAMAQSSKFSAHEIDGVIISDGAGGVGSLHIPLKTANKSDLLVGVSLQSSKNAASVSLSAIAAPIVPSAVAVSCVSVAIIYP